MERKPRAVFAAKPWQDSVVGRTVFQSFKPPRWVGVDFRGVESWRRLTSAATGARSCSRLGGAQAAGLGADRSAVLPDRLLGHAQLPGDFGDRIFADQVVDDGDAAGSEPTRQLVKEIVRAGCCRDIIQAGEIFGVRFKVVRIGRKRAAGRAVFQRVNAVAGAKVIYELEPAVLEIPTPGMAWVSEFVLPQMEESFLDQVLLDRSVVCDAVDNAVGQVENLGLIN